MIIVNGYRLNLEDGDELDVFHHECGKCGYHTEITVRRGNKEIASLGDAVRLLDMKDEVYGGVVVDKQGNTLPDPRRITHIIPNDKSGMTKDRYYYVGMCGKVLRGDHNYTFITFPSNMSYLSKRERETLCKDCLKEYEKQK